MPFKAKTAKQSWECTHCRRRPEPGFKLCPSCRASRSRYKTKADPKKLIAQRRGRYLARRSEVLAIAATYRKARPEKYREWTAKWRAANPDRVRASQSKAGARNKERRAAYARARSQTERFKEMKRASRARHADKAKKYEAQYRQANRHKLTAKENRRRAKFLRAIPPWADKEKIEEWYELRDFVSKLSGIKYHVDHIVPLQGRTVSGLHCEANLQLLTASQNSRKGNRMSH